MSADLDGHPGPVAFLDLDAAASVVGDRDQDLDLARALDEPIELLQYVLALDLRVRRE